MINFSTRNRSLLLAAAFGLAGCGALTATQAIADVDSVLNAACASLTFLPSQVAVCAGVQGAEALASLIDQFVSQSSNPATANAVRALRAARARPSGGLAAEASAVFPSVKIRNLPAYAPPDLAAALNEAKENAALVAFVKAGLAQGADAGAAR